MDLDAQIYNPNKLRRATMRENLLVSVVKTFNFACVKDLGRLDRLDTANLHQQILLLRQDCQLLMVSARPEQVC